MGYPSGTDHAVRDRRVRTSAAQFVPSRPAAPPRVGVAWDHPRAVEGPAEDSSTLAQPSTFVRRRVERGVTLVAGKTRL